MQCVLEKHGCRLEGSVVEGCGIPEPFSIPRVKKISRIFHDSVYVEFL